MHRLRKHHSLFPVRREERGCRSRRSQVITLVVFAAVFVASATLPAQPAPAQQQQPPAGLDSLTDDKLIADLANRGLTTLLNRAYEVNNVPPNQRGNMQTLVAVKRLADPKLTIRQRDELIPQIVKGVDLALPAINDPQV